MTQKWEYLFVSCAYYRNEWHPKALNGKEIKDWVQTPTFSEYSNQLGNQGWELVESSGFLLDPGGIHHAQLSFKRPKP